VIATNRRMRENDFVSMTDTTYPIRVFVYGTLKRGGSNHDFMMRAGGVFLCEAETREKRRLIVDGLPYLCDGLADDGHNVEGEIFEIPDARGLALIDGLEGNGHFYRRRIDEFVERRTNAEPRETSAWVYYVMASKTGEPQVRFEVDRRKS